MLFFFYSFKKKVQDNVCRLLWFQLLDAILEMVFKVFVFFQSMII